MTAKRPRKEKAARRAATEPKGTYTLAEAIALARDAVGRRNPANDQPYAMLRLPHDAVRQLVVAAELQETSRPAGPS